MLHNFHTLLDEYLSVTSDPGQNPDIWPDVWHLVLANLAFTEHENLVASKNMHIGQAPPHERPAAFLVLDLFAPIYTGPSPSAATRIVMIVASELPVLPVAQNTNPADDPNVPLISKADVQLIQHVARFFANPESANTIQGLVTVGRLWGWRVFRRAADCPSMELGELEDAYLARTEGQLAVVETKSNLFHLRTEESDAAFARIQSLLSHE